MRRYTGRYLGLAILAGAGIGIGCGCLLFNEELRHRIGRKMRRIARACRYQGAELRETASEIWERGGRTVAGARNTGKKMYQRLAG